MPSRKSALYRVVYGETMPAWERMFESLQDARKFASKQTRLGDIVFSICRVVPGEQPQSLMGMMRNKIA